MTGAGPVTFPVPVPRDNRYNMPVSLPALQLHLDYSGWASARLLEAAARLTPAERNRDFGTADRSVLGTLVHIFGADRAWMARVRGQALVRYLAPEDYEFERLQSAWPALQRDWRDWAAGLEEASVHECRTYQDLKGNTWTTPLWQIVLHVVNHGTHHRGQAAGFLRSMGHAPPALDLIAYYRSLAQ